MNRQARPSQPRLRLIVAAVLFAATSPAFAQELRLPMKEGSVRFAIMGDTGTASTAQFDVGKQMAAFHGKFPFEFVIMVGDNIYGGSSAPDAMKSRFEAPYAALLDAKVKFWASLGNHDNASEANYKNWNMIGQRFYTFRVADGGASKVGVRFFALDSNYMDQKQLQWVQSELKNSTSEWKIAFFHHPLYSSGRTHGSAKDLRSLIEPLFMANGVTVVFAGHDHFYERIKPQNGIYHFVTGAGGSLRKGDIDRSTGLTEVGFDTDYSFMLAEISGLDFYFQAISRTGKTVDSGVIHHTPFAEVALPAAPLPASPGSTQVVPAPVAAQPPVGPTPSPAPTPAPSASPSPSAQPTPKATPSPTPKPTPVP
jgi:hypothetical protein